PDVAFHPRALWPSDGGALHAELAAHQAGWPATSRVAAGSNRRGDLAAPGCRRERPLPAGRSSRALHEPVDCGGTGRAGDAGRGPGDALRFVSAIEENDARTSRPRSDRGPGRPYRSAFGAAGAVTVARCPGERGLVELVAGCRGAGRAGARLGPADRECPALVAGRPVGSPGGLAGVGRAAPSLPRG